MSNQYFNQYRVILSEAESLCKVSPKKAIDFRAVIDVLRKVDSNILKGLRFEFEDLKREIDDAATDKMKKAKSGYDFYEVNWIQPLKNLRSSIETLSGVYNHPISDKDFAELITLVSFMIEYAEGQVSYLFQGNERFRAYITIKDPKSEIHLNIDDWKFWIYALSRDKNTIEHGNRIASIFSQITGEDFSDYVPVVNNKARNKKEFLEKIEKLLPD